MAPCFLSTIRARPLLRENLGERFEDEDWDDADDPRCRVPNELQEIQGVLQRAFGGGERFWIDAGPDGAITLTDVQTPYRLREGRSLSECLERVLSFEEQLRGLPRNADPEEVEELFRAAVFDAFAEVGPGEPGADAQERSAPCPNCGEPLTLSAEFLANGHAKALDRIHEADIRPQVDDDGGVDLEVFCLGACLACRKPWNAELQFRGRVTLRYGVELAAVHALELTAVSLHAL